MEEKKYSWTSCRFTTRSHTDKQPANHKYTLPVCPTQIPKTIKTSLLRRLTLDHSHCYMSRNKLRGQPHNFYSRLYINSLMQAHKLSRPERVGWWATVGSTVWQRSWSGSRWMECLGETPHRRKVATTGSYGENIIRQSCNQSKRFSRAGQSDYNFMFRYQAFLFPNVIVRIT